MTLDGLSDNNILFYQSFMYMEPDQVHLDGQVLSRHRIQKTDKTCPNNQTVGTQEQRSGQVLVYQVHRDTHNGLMGKKS
jgi:hypothetical protein